MALTKVQSGFVDLTTTSGLSVGSGSSTTPALNFGTNTTGLFGDNDEVGISVGSSRILTAKNGNIGINNASPSQRLEVSGTTRTSYLTLPSPGSGNAAITVDSFNAGCLIRRNAGTGVGTSLGVLYSSAAPYLAYHMYANTNSSTYAEYPLKSSSSSSLTRSAILVNNYGIALGTGFEYNASVNEAIPHTHFRYNAVVNTDGNLVLNQHTNGDSGNRGIYFRITPNQTLPFSTLSKALINFKRTTTNARGQLDLVVDDADDTNSVTVSDKPNLSLRTDKNVPRKFLHFATAEDFGTTNGNVNNVVSSDMAAGGRSYITLQSVTTNNETNSNDPAWVSWKGSVSNDGSLPCGGYSARMGGYRDAANNGSTSIGFESVQDVATSPHTMQRNMTIRYDGRVAIGTNLNPNCALDISTHTGAINLPKGTDAQRPTTTGSAGMLRWNTNSSTLEFSDGNGWDYVWSKSAATSSDQISSTSGNIVTTSDGYKIHEFTASGTFTNNGTAQVAEIYVVGGGGGGGGGGSNAGSPGGGGGGMAYGSISIPNGSFTVTVGGGGAGGVAAGSNDGSSSAGASGVTSSVTIGGVTFQATGGGGGAGNSGSSNGGGASFSPVAGGSGGTGTIGGGTSYDSPALRDDTPITSKYGTGGTGGSSGGLDGSGNGTVATDGSNGSNSAAGGGGGGDNKADNGNVGPAGEGGNGDANFFTGGGGGGAADGDGNNTTNLAQGGTGKFAGGNGGDVNSDATNGAGPSGGSKGPSGSSRKNNGGGGGSYGGGGGGGADAANSHGGGGGQGGGGLVVIKYLV